MSNFVRPDQPAMESFLQLKDLFNVSSPAQLRDQVIWRGICRITWLLDQSDETRELLATQEKIFRIAQEVDNILAGIG